MWTAKEQKVPLNLLQDDKVICNRLRGDKDKMNDIDEELQPPLVHPTPLNFGTPTQGVSVTLPLLINNPNKQKLLWCADEGEMSWLTLDKNTGNLEAGEQEQVNVTVDTSSLEVGDHQSTLTFTWVGDDYSVSAQIPVMLNLTPMSPIAVGLSFSLMPMSSTTLPLAITNRSDQTVDWIVNMDETSWLTLDRRSGSLQANEQQTIYVTANSSPLRIGDYTSVLNFTPKEGVIKLEEADDPMSGSDQLPVTLHVSNRPFGDNGPKAPRVNSNSFDVEQNTTKSFQLDITNLEGRGKIQWTITTGGVTWVTFKPSSSGIFQHVNDKATVTVTVDANTLAPGMHTDLRLTLAFVDPPLSSLEPTSILIRATISS
jgi:Viral BACON domain